jgi:hypothetical protein
VVAGVLSVATNLISVTVFSPPNGRCIPRINSFRQLSGGGLTSIQTDGQF